MNDKQTKPSKVKQQAEQEQVQVFSQQTAAQQVPHAKSEDVEFNAELADADDLEATERAQAADARQQH